MEIPLFWQVQDVLTALATLFESRNRVHPTSSRHKIFFFGADLDSDKVVNSAQI